MQLAEKLSKYAFCIASVVPLIAFSNEMSQDDVEHGPVGSRPISEQAETSMLEQAVQSQTDILENLQQSYQNKSEFQELGSIKQYWFGSDRSIPQHWIKGINYQTKVIVTEEGAHWKIPSNRFSQMVLNFWLINDSVTIRPLYNNSNYPYELKNKTNGFGLPVELILGPELNSIHTLWIRGYDMGAKKVYLSNDSCWMIADADMTIFRDWEPNDQIIIGSSNSWFSSYNAILINPQTNNFVRAKTY